MAEIVHNKLVRDNILDIIKESGKDFSYHIAREDEYKSLLIEKIQEEVMEFVENPCAEEIADILEVIDSLISVLGYSKEEVESVKEKKGGEKGAFTKGIVLEKVFHE